MVEHLRVFCWNIVRGELNGLEPIARQIEARNPDIVLLNEIRTFSITGPPSPENNQALWLARRLGMPHYVFGEIVAMGGAGWNGCAVLSRFPLGPVTTHLVPPHVLPFFDAWGTVETSIVLDGLVHRIFSLRYHKYNRCNTDPDHPNEQERQANIRGHQHATELVANIPAHEAIILGGDFNAPIYEPWSAEFTAFAAERGLIDVFDKRPDILDPCGDVDYCEEGRTRNYIDRVFVRGPYQIANVELRCKWDDVEPSDHPWVFTELRRKRRQSFAPIALALG